MDGWTPLSFAIKERNVDTVKFLIQASADVSRAEECGISLRSLIEDAYDPNVGLFGKMDMPGKMLPASIARRM